MIGRPLERVRTQFAKQKTAEHISMDEVVSIDRAYVVDLRPEVRFDPSEDILVRIAVGDLGARFA